MSRKKVTVVGGGFVGSTTAQRIVDLELADVVLTDILDGPPAGKALDMMESGPITRTGSHATGICTASGDYSATAGSDVVVITNPDKLYAALDLASIPRSTIVIDGWRLLRKQAGDSPNYVGLGLGDDNQRLSSALAGMWNETARTRV